MMQSVVPTMEFNDFGMVVYLMCMLRKTSLLYFVAQIYFLTHHHQLFSLTVFVHEKRDVNEHRLLKHPRINEIFLDITSDVSLYQTRKTGILLIIIDYT